jgi:small-conductance mechanosensitive channel
MSELSIAAMFLEPMVRRDWMIGIFLFCAVVIFGNGIHYLIFRLLRKKQAETQSGGLGLKKFLEGPARAVFLTIAVRIVLPFVPDIAPSVRDQVDQVVEVLLVISLGWLAIGGVYVAQAVLLRRFDITVANNLRARRLHTQFQFLRRILIAAIVVVDAAALLWSMHNPGLWKYGTGLLASAGLASLALAAAGKSTVSNLLAGMQIALAEPIRIDDVVVIAGEWGRIAEITSTYVVVNIWDQRTLIVPLSYFIEQPFANWTRTGAEILGTAFLYLDYAVPVEALRAELNRIVQETPLWDKRVCGLQVTNLSEKTMEVRCLVSSADSGKNFDLRCLVREKMIDFVREHYPHAMPTMRVEARRDAMREQEQQLDGGGRRGEAPKAESASVNGMQPNPLESTGATS